MLPHRAGRRGPGSVVSHDPHGRLRDRSWGRTVESTSHRPGPGRRGEVEEATVTTATGDRQAAGTRAGRRARSGRLRRIRAAGATALLVGAVACSATPA